jgi:hypothetical protein
MIRLLLISILLYLVFRWIGRIISAFNSGKEQIKNAQFRVYRQTPFDTNSSTQPRIREKDVTDRGRVIED